MMMDYRGTIAVTTCLVLALVLPSCSDNQAVRLRYETEKLYHYAERDLRDIQTRPGSDRKQAIRTAADKYGRAFEFSLDALDSINNTANPVEYREVQYLAFQAASRFSQLHFSARHYDSCVSIMNRLLSTVALHDSQLMTTRLNLGQALQASGSWDSALAVYNMALDEFYPPVDDTGEVVVGLHGLPLRVFQVVNTVGDSAAGSVQFNRAERYYQKLVADYPDSKVSAASHANLARLYQSSGRWKKVAGELSTLLDTTADDYFNILINIADIHASRLGNTDTALFLYSDILNKLEPADTLLRPLVLFKICLASMDQADYDKARKLLVNLRRNFPGFYAATPAAQYVMARTFELQGKWNRAETEYKYLIEKYRDSDEAMSTFLYLADHFKEKGLQDQADKWLNDAEAYYEEMAVHGAGTILEARSLVYKADLYRRQGAWETTAQTLSLLFDKFPDTEPGRKGLLKAATIYRDKLYDPARADSLIELLRSSLAQVDSWKN